MGLSIQKVAGFLSARYKQNKCMITLRLIGLKNTLLCSLENVFWNSYFLHNLELCYDKMYLKYQEKTLSSNAFDISTLSPMSTNNFN